MIGPVDMAAQGIGLEPRWGNVKLKYLLKSVGSGGTPSTDVPSFWAENGEDGYPWVAIADMSRTSIVSTTAKRVTPEGLRSKGLAVWPSGTLLMSMYASLGHVATLGVPAATNQAILALHPRNDVDPGYLSYWLKAIQPLLKGEANSNTQDNLNAEKVGNLPATKPPFEEQRRIAAFLDHETARIDELVREQEQLQALLLEKRQAEILRFITKGIDPSVKLKDSGVEWLGRIPEHWRVARVKHLSPVQRGASPRPIDDPIYFDDQGEYAWVRISDVSKAGKHLLETTQQLSALGSSLSVKLEPGNLFLSIAGTVGKPCITRIRACIHDGFVYFPRLTINPEFLYYVFEAGQAYLGLGKFGTQLNLNTETVGNIEIGLPPADEIEKILLAVRHSTQKLDLLLEANQESIDLLLERRSALISAAVTGQLDLSDWRLPEPEAVAEVA